MAKSGVVDWGSDEGNSNSNGSNYEEEDDPAFEVERIIAQREVNDEIQYLVKWMEFGDEECTWEPIDSFDQTSSISLWEDARDRGDVLDPAELQAVEARMARHEAEQKKAHANPKKEAKQIPVRASPDLSLLHRVFDGEVVESTRKQLPAKFPKLTVLGNEPNVTRENFSRIVLTSGLSTETRSDRDTSKSVTAKPPPALTSAHPIQSRNRDHKMQRQEFHGLSDRSSPSGHTLQNQKGTTKNRHQEPGKRYRNLSHQNNDQKRRKQEPPPNIMQIGKLVQVSELVPGHDVALNLPSGPSRLSVATIHTGEIFVENLMGELEPVSRSDGPKFQDNNKQLSKQNFEKINQTAREVSPQSLHESRPQSTSEVKHMRFGTEYLPYKWGEVVVQISFGTRLIGHVKVLGLGSSMIAALLRTKQGPILSMTFEQADVVGLRDYQSFAREIGFGCVGSLEPYENAKTSVTELLDFFNQHSEVAGVWVDPLLPWGIFIYSSTAAAFAQQGWPHCKVGLSFVASSRIPWERKEGFTSGIRNKPKLVEHIPSQELSPMEIDSAHDFLVTDYPANSSDTGSPIHSVEYSATNGNPSHDSCGNRPSRQEPSSQIHVDRPIHTQRNTEFEESYSITYERLMQVPTSVKSNGAGTGKFNRNIVRFFLAFDTPRCDEEAKLKNWLSLYTPGHLVFSSSQEYDWERYKDGLKSADHVGVILIHQEYLQKALGFLSGLAKRVRREDVQIFRVSLSRPLDNAPHCHFSRLFPSGLVIAIPEGSILSHPQRISNILRWFVRACNGRKNWKILLRPHAEQYFQELSEADIAEEDRSWHQKSLFHLRSLSFSRGDESPFADSVDDDNSENYVLSPLTLTVYNKTENRSPLVTLDQETIAARDVRLLDFFGGWSAHQIEKFRKFVALPNSPSERKTMKLARRYFHVDFSMSCEEFVTVYTAGRKDSNGTAGFFKDAKPTSPVIK